MSSNYKTLVDVVIKAEVAGTRRHELVLRICEHPPAPLLAVGVPDLPVVIRASTIGKVFFDHAISQHQIASLEDMLTTSSAVYKSATRPEDSVVVVTIHTQNGATILVALAMNVQQGYEQVNRITSMYGKTGPDREPRWRADGLQLYPLPKPNP